MQDKRQKSMLSESLEPAIPVIRHLNIYAVDRTANRIGFMGI
jgi:hypothetical protein